MVARVGIGDDVSHVQTLLQRHRAGRTGDLERDIAFSWLWCLAAVFSYALLLSDVLRTGAAITRYPYPGFESNQFMFFGPFAYSVTHIRHNETAGSRDVWAYKYDSTSIGMRAVAEHLSIARWPSCVLYKTECSSRSIAFSTVFDMLDALVERTAKQYAGMTLDLAVVESSTDNSKPALSFQGRKFYDIVFITRVRDCTGSACFTVATDDFRYQAASITSNAEDSYSVVVVLRSLGQVYMWVRVILLFVGCYYARSAEPRFANASVAKRMAVGLRTMFLVPSQVVTYGSVFPVACYVLAHIFDSAIAYEVVAQKFNSFLGVFTLDPEEFLYLSAVSMRSVWVLALLLHAVLFMRTRRHWSPMEGVPGVPEFFISFISCLTIMAQFRSIYFRDSRVLSIDEVVPSAHVATIRAFSYNSAFSFWGLMLTGNTQDAKLHLAKRIKMYVASRSQVSYAAGTLWPTSALVISWNGLFVMSELPSKSRIAIPDERSREVESMIYLMNLAVMTDPIVLLQLYGFGGKPVGVYESRVTQRLFLLPLAARANASTFDAIAWDEYALLAEVSTADLSWWDLLQCG